MGRSGGLEVWRLDSVPLMSVGDTEADLLHQVAGVAITPRHVVIAQESTGTLRFYDWRGSLDDVVRLMGSVALSPPEEYLAGLSALGVFSDGSLLADLWDVRFRPTEPAVQRLPVTLLLFDNQGGFVHRLPEMTGPEGWYEPVGTTGTRQMFRLFGRVTEAVVIDSLFGCGKRLVRHPGVRA